MAGEGGRKAVLAALVGNASIAVTKFAAWSFTGSSAMLAEAIHSVANAGNQAFLLLGARQARKVADDERQFGYGRGRYFWSFVVALILFVLGSAFATYHGVEKILHPEPIENFLIALAVLGVGIIIEGFTFRTALVAAIPLKGDLSWWQYIRRAREPELPVVLLEDFGAQVGLIIAFVAITVAEVTANPVWDGIGSLAIGILLGFIAIILIIEMRSLLIGEGARPRDMKTIESAILSRPEVLELVHLRTQYLGPDELLVAARIEFDSSLSMTELADAVGAVERTVREDAPHANPIYIEPDLRRFSSADDSDDEDANGDGRGDDEDASGDDGDSILLGAEAETANPFDTSPDASG